MYPSLEDPFTVRPVLKSTVQKLSIVLGPTGVDVAKKAVGGVPGKRSALMAGAWALKSTSVTSSRAVGRRHPERPPSASSEHLA
jgi:hypothetical protein